MNKKGTSPPKYLLRSFKFSNATWAEETKFAFEDKYDANLDM